MDFNCDFRKQRRFRQARFLATASCILALAPWFLYGLSSPVSVKAGSLYLLVPWVLSVCVGLCVLLFSRRGSLGKVSITLATSGIVIPIAYIAFALFYGNALNRLIYKPMEEIRACQSNMSRLYTSLKGYALNHDGLLPAGPNWCDELLEENDELAAIFVCQYSDGKPGQSSYALNKNVAGQKLSDLARDTVLLFETTAGWNQVGGPELVTTDNHSQVSIGDNHSVGSTGHCNVVFARGRAQHFPSDKIHELRWETGIAKTP